MAPGTDACCGGDASGIGLAKSVCLVNRGGVDSRRCHGRRPRFPSRERLLSGAAQVGLLDGGVGLDLGERPERTMRPFSST
jgi:hypothetical protein